MDARPSPPKKELLGRILRTIWRGGLPPVIVVNSGGRRSVRHEGEGGPITDGKVELFPACINDRGRNRGTRAESVSSAHDR